MLRVTWAGWELPPPCIERPLGVRGVLTGGTALGGEQAVPLLVSLLLRPDTVGQSSRKKYSHLYFFKLQIVSDIVFKTEPRWLRLRGCHCE